MAHLPAHTVEFGLADRAVTIPVHPVKSPVGPIPERKFITAQHTVAVAIGACHHPPGVRFCLFHRLIFQFLETERSVPIGIRPCDMVLTALAISSREICPSALPSRASKDTREP